MTSDIPPPPPSPVRKTMATLMHKHWRGRQASLLLPHRSSVEPAAGARGEEALHHGLADLRRRRQPGVARGAGSLGVPEALQARGVPHVQHKHST